MRVRRLGLGTLALSLCLLTAGSAAPAGAEDPAYCEPTATALDPADVPAGGSQLAPVEGVRERRITIGGIGTRLLAAGPARARTAVVFVHGSPGSAADWANLLPQVARRHVQAIAFDIPGFGHADPAWAIQPTADSGADGLEDVLRQLRIRRAHLVLHDIGGPLGLQWAARHPKRLRSAVLIDTGLLMNYHHHSLAQITRTPGVGETFWAQLNRESFSAGVQEGQTRPLPAEFVNRMYDDLDRETRCAILRLYRGTDEPEIHAFAAHQAEVLAHRRKRPALVIWGADDPYLPPSIAADQRAGFPAARIHIFDDAGHWPFVDYEAEARKLIAGFLRTALKRDRRRR